MCRFWPIYRITLTEFPGEINRFSVSCCLKAIVRRLVRGKRDGKVSVATLLPVENTADGFRCLSFGKTVLLEKGWEAVCRCVLFCAKKKRLLALSFVVWLPLTGSRGACKETVYRLERETGLEPATACLEGRWSQYRRPVGMKWLYRLF